jgi:hypothetical protein
MPGRQERLFYSPTNTPTIHYIRFLVGERGFEPPTPWSRTRCSTRLSHSPNLRLDGRCGPKGSWLNPLKMLPNYSRVYQKTSRAK